MLVLVSVLSHSLERNADLLFSVYQKAEQLVVQLEALRKRCEPWVVLGTVDMQDVIAQNLHSYQVCLLVDVALMKEEKADNRTGPKRIGEQSTCVDQSENHS